MTLIWQKIVVKVEKKNAGIFSFFCSLLVCFDVIFIFTLLHTFTYVPVSLIELTPQKQLHSMENKLSNH